MPEHDRLIILDFDHTVFNTTKFVAALKKRFKKDFDISEEAFMDYRNRTKDRWRVIDIDKFVEEVPHADKAATHQAVHDIIKQHAEDYVFADVIPFIEKHQDKFDILVATHGDQELQTEKISHSWLPEGVGRDISLYSKDKVVGRYIENYKEIHFVDDKAVNIDAVKTAWPQVKTYFMQRPEDSPYAGSPSKCECADEVIRGLEDLNL